MSKPLDPFNRLSEEADRLTEPFSPSLHAKVMRRVGEEAAGTTRSKGQLYILWSLCGACVAVVLIAVTVSLWLRSTPLVSPNPNPPTASANGISLVEWLNQAAEPVRQSIYRTTAPLVMGGLDQDAKAFGHFMLEQVGQLPRKRV